MNPRRLGYCMLAATAVLLITAAIVGAVIGSFWLVFFYLNPWLALPVGCGILFLVIATCCFYGDDSFMREYPS